VDETACVCAESRAGSKIACTQCPRWIHLVRAGLTQEQAEVRSDDSYICVKCEAKNFEQYDDLTYIKEIAVRRSDGTVKRKNGIGIARC
jgi:hypothetical protein